MNLGDKRDVERYLWGASVILATADDAQDILALVQRALYKLSVVEEG